MYKLSSQVIVMIKFSFNLRLLLPSCLLALVGAAACTGHSGSNAHNIEVIPTEAISQLNAVLEDASYYRDRKEAEFDSLKRLLSVTTDRHRKGELCIELSERSRKFRSDSSILFARMAIKFYPEEEKREHLRANLALANALSTAGLFQAAGHCLDSVSATATSLADKIEIWKASRMFYSYMMGYVEDLDAFHHIYKNEYMAIDDSLLRYLPKKDPFYRFIYCERLVSDGHITEARNNLENFLKTIPREDNLFGMAAYQLAEVYKNKGDFRSYAENLALAAESDLRSQVKDGLALPTLAHWLYDHGDIENAFTYINYALEDASRGNMRQQTLSVAPLIPVIDKELKEQSNTWRMQMMISIVVVTTLLIVSGTLLAGVVITNRKRMANERKLAVTYRKLETYVGNFIGLCSSYAARLDQLSKLVTRKINAHQTDDLLKMVSSGRFADDDDDFYKLIDKALTDLFPDFVASINTLLPPDKQIVLKNDDPLTPELRIYAFVRLGVEQSAKIAQILGYSVNTVYTYRNRMRNRAIDKDNFDSQVMNL